MELINGRTPDEIKQGLKACSNVRCGTECPYGGMVYGCIGALNADSLALIKHLESKVFVVHCKDCKHADQIGESGYWCNEFGNGRDADHYCSKGEKK